MNTDPAKLYMNAMIMSHLTYCLTSFAQANKKTKHLNHLKHCINKNLKVLDQKSNTFHHLLILGKSKLFSWDNLIKYPNLCLIFKILHNTAPPPL